MDRGLTSYKLDGFDVSVTSAWFPPLRSVLASSRYDPLRLPLGGFDGRLGGGFFGRLQETQ